MKLLTFLYSGQKHAGVVVEGGVVPILDINSKHRTRLPNNLLEIIQQGVKDIPVKRRAADSRSPRCGRYSPTKSRPKSGASV